MSSVYQVDAQTAVELRQATKECSERGMIVATKWCAILVLRRAWSLTRDIRTSELLLALPLAKRREANDSDSQHALNFSTSTPARAKSLGPATSFPSAPSLVPTQATTPDSGPGIDSRGQPADVSALENELEDQDSDKLSAARAFIDSREFSRAIHVLRDGRSAKARFIRVYSKFMVSLWPGRTNAGLLRHDGRLVKRRPCVTGTN
jgi:anaphase-promoting complex subunit 8